MKTTKAFNDYFGNFGFAFARTEVRPEIDRATNRVKLTLVAEPARRAYVRRVNVAGNTRTRDQIIRREMRQMEAAWYDGDKIRLSKDRLNRLGYFKDVNIDTQEVAGTADQVDLTVNVEEKPTGMITLGAGFSSAEGVVLSMGVQQDNAFGTGHNVGVMLNTSNYNRYYVISTTDPYFTEDGVSRTFDYSYRTIRPFSTMGGDYSLVTSGLGVRFGIPVTELDRIFVGATAEHITINPGNLLPEAYQSYANDFGYSTRTTPLTIGWARDSRDSYINPNSGKFMRVNSEYGAGGDVRYTRTGAQFQQYFPLSKQYTFAFNVDAAAGHGLKGQPYPVFKNYYLGGLGSVRGFQPGTLGPKDLTTGAYIGGNRKFTLNTEFLAPFPGAGNDRTLRLYGFYDMGNVFGANQAFDTSQFRSSYGFGLSWVSPLGPLRLAWARPIRYQEGDRIEYMQFQIGTSF